MSATTLGQQGVAAANANNFTEALPKLTTALSLSTTKPPSWLIARSKCLVSAGDFAAALSDASLAYNVASDRNDRELMMEAQYRRAVAYYRLGRYADADCCCVWALNAVEGKKMSEGAEQASRVDEEGEYEVTAAEVKEYVDRALRDGEDGLSKMSLLGLSGAVQQKKEEDGKGKKSFKSNPKWIRTATFRTQCIMAMEKLEKGAAGRKVSAAKNPPKAEWTAGSKGQEQLDKEAEEARKKKAASSASVKGKGVEKSSASAPAQAKPVRIESYQAKDTQTISVMVKGVDKDTFKMEWKSASEITLHPVPGVPDDTLTLNLGGEANQAASTSRVTPLKIELVIKKPSEAKWDNPQMVTENTAPRPSKVVADRPPAYPTSAKSGPKDWENLADLKGDDIDKTTSAEDWLINGLGPNMTEEQRRAATKSFYESGGTVLNTNWDDVKDRTVEPQPPEGVEAKKWNS